MQFSCCSYSIDLYNSALGGGGGGGVGLAYVTELILCLELEYFYHGIVAMGLLWCMKCAVMTHKCN